MPGPAVVAGPGTEFYARWHSTSAFLTVTHGDGKGNSLGPNRFKTLASSGTDIAAARGFIDRTYMPKPAAVLAFALSALPTLVFAAPITMYFTGAVSKYTDTVKNTTVAGNAGMAVSGYMTFDAANAATMTASVNVSPQGTSIWEGYSSSGCGYSWKGACLPGYDSGTGTPVVTDYLFSIGGAVYHPLDATSGTFRDVSERYNSEQTVGQPNPIETWMTHRSQIGATADGPSPDNYAYRYRMLNVNSVGINILSLASSILGQGFETPLAPYWQSLTFADESYRTCTMTKGCPTGTADPGAFWIEASLQSVEFRNGPANIPLPGTLALLLAGGIATGIAGRRP